MTKKRTFILIKTFFVKLFRVYFRKLSQKSFYYDYKKQIILK